MGKKGTCWNIPGAVNQQFRQEMLQHQQQAAQMSALGGSAGQGLSPRETRILDMLGTLLTPETKRRWRQAVLETFRYIRDGPQKDRPKPMERHNCPKCKGGGPNVPHHPLCAENGRRFNSMEEKQVYVKVKQALLALIKDDARWTDQVRSTFHDDDGSTTAAQLNDRRSVAPIFRKESVQQGPCREHDDAIANVLRPPASSGHLVDSPTKLTTQEEEWILNCESAFQRRQCGGNGESSTSHDTVLEGDGAPSPARSLPASLGGVNGASDCPSCGLVTSIQKGMEASREAHQDDNDAYVDYCSVFGSSAGFAQFRELPAMRRLISEVMRGVPLHGSPYQDGLVCQGRVPHALVRYRAVDGKLIRNRPVIYEYDVNGISVHVVNWCSLYNSRLLSDCGHSGIPCGNPLCKGDSASGLGSVSQRFALRMRPPAARRRPPPPALS